MGLPATCTSPNAASFNPNGTMIDVACSDGSARVFSASTGLELTVMQLPASSAASINSAQFGRYGDSVLTASSAGTTGAIQIWSTQLATPSLSTLEGIGRQPVQRGLTP